MTYDESLRYPRLLISPPYKTRLKNHFDGCEHKVLILKHQILRLTRFKEYKCSKCSEILKIPILGNIILNE